jgi:hypothetical protein
MIDLLQEVATEVNNVSLKISTEGKLGGQAFVQGISGTWKELVENINAMAVSLTV